MDAERIGLFYLFVLEIDEEIFASCYFVEFFVLLLFTVFL